MSNRWYIFKDEAVLGPYEPAQIREALREGSIDPFDQVARDGSSVRRDLVEVDEIFQNSKVVYGGLETSAPEFRAQADEMGSSADGTAPRHMRYHGEDEPRESDESALENGQGQQALQGYIPDAWQEASGKPEGPVIGEGHLHLADPSVAEGGARPASLAGRGVKRRRRNPKAYQVLDGRGRVLGPLSASEIQALYYRGVLDKSVRVIKSGSSAKIPVARFAAVLSGVSKNRGGPHQGAHPVFGVLNMGRQGRRAKGVGVNTLQAMAQGKSMSAMSVLAICLGIVIVGLAAAAFLKYRQPAVSWFERVGGKGAEVPVFERKAPTQHKGVQGKDFRAKPMRKPAQEHPPAKTHRAKPDQRASSAQPAPKKSLGTSKERLQRAQAQHAAQRREQARLIQARADLERRQREHLEGLQRRRDLERRQRAALAAQALARSRAQSVAAASPVKKGRGVPQATSQVRRGPSLASLRDGQTVSRLGPLTFSEAQVQACSAACAVPFHGLGGVLTVKFFKQSWGPALLKQGGKAYVSGLVQKSGGVTSLMLSGVQ